MDSQLTQKFVEDIVNASVLGNWKYWLLLVAIVFVSTTAASYIAAYLARRGQNAADRIDRQAILDQLRATTAAAEQIRIDIQHADWAAKEWKTTRRTKLEAFYNQLYESKEWVEDYASIRIFAREKQEQPSPISKLEILCRIYLPELLGDVKLLTLTWSEMIVAVADASTALLQARENMAQRQVVFETFKAAWQPLYARSAQQIAAIELRVPEVLAAINELER